MGATEKMAKRIAAQSTASLKEMAAKLYVDMRDEASIVLSAVLDALMLRLPEAEFVSFCEALEG